MDAGPDERFEVVHHHGGHTFVVRFGRHDARAAVDALVADATDGEHPFTWYDLAVVVPIVERRVRRPR